MSPISSTLTHYAPTLSRHARQAIEDVCQEAIIPAGKLFITVDQRDTYEYILTEGLARSFC